MTILRKIAKILEEKFYFPWEDSFQIISGVDSMIVIGNLEGIRDKFKLEGEAIPEEEILGHLESRVIQEIIDINENWYNAVYYLSHILCYMTGFIITTELLRSVPDGVYVERAWILDSSTKLLALKCEYKPLNRPLFIVLGPGIIL